MKKWLTMVLVLCMLGTLTACNKPKEEETLEIGYAAVLWPMNGTQSSVRAQLAGRRIGG